MIEQGVDNFGAEFKRTSCDFSFKHLTQNNCICNICHGTGAKWAFSYVIRNYLNDRRKNHICKTLQAHERSFWICPACLENFTKLTRVQVSIPVPENEQNCCKNCRHHENYDGWNEFNCKYYNGMIRGEQYDCEGFSKSDGGGRGEMIEDTAKDTTPPTCSTACSTTDTTPPTCSTTDTISRQAAIRWVKTECNPYGKPTIEFESRKRVIKHLEQMPPAQPEPKWIPVNEELPDVGQSVLLSTTRGHVLAGYRLEPSSLYLVTDDEDGKEMWVYDPDSYTDTYGDDVNDLPRSEDCGFSDASDSYSFLAVTSPNYDARFQGVTAWMPLPETYKEAEKHGTD